MDIITVVDNVPLASNSLCSLFIPLEFTLICVYIEYTSNSRVHCLDWIDPIVKLKGNIFIYLCSPAAALIAQNFGF